MPGELREYLFTNNQIKVCWALCWALLGGLCSFDYFKLLSVRDYYSDAATQQKLQTNLGQTKGVLSPPGDENVIKNSVGKFDFVQTMPGLFGEY